MNSFAVAMTGHRPPKLGGYQALAFHSLLKEGLKSMFLEIGPSHIISGMALGIDQIAVQAAIELEIPFHAYVPCKDQERMWPPASRAFYNKLLLKAAKVTYVTNSMFTPQCMQLRNVAMIDAAECLLGVWDHSPGGTANCIQYARKKLQEEQHSLKGLYTITPKDLADGKEWTQEVNTQMEMFITSTYKAFKEACDE